MGTRLVATAVAACGGVALVLAVVTSCGGAGGYNPQIDPADFSTVIDNPLLPFQPGTTFVYEGDTPDGHTHVDLVVTPDTKVSIGVTCVIVRDMMTIDGQLAEVALDWYAQRNGGAVWYFGEDTKDYKTRNVISTKGSWEAGVNGAKPGIVMQAHPEVGDPYRQEYAKGVAEDMATAVSLTQSVTVPYGSFTDCLKTKEFSPLEPGVVECKWYAPGVGNVVDADIKLVSVTHE
jgi:hypothetical protein